MLTQECAATNTDYLLRNFDRIEEPLNLKKPGQEWFGRVYNSFHHSGSTGLVLGATPWLATLLCRAHPHVTVIDQNPAMIAMVQKSDPGRRLNGSYRVSEVHCSIGDWLTALLPPEIGTVAADNAFAFLPFPSGWKAILDRLADSMEYGANLITRTLSVPQNHRNCSGAEIAGYYLKGDKRINYTEVRAQLLFSQWNKNTKAIDTEAALESYEANLPAFHALYDRDKAPLINKDLVINDLVTVEKYRGCGVSYYAPELENILQVLRDRFRVEQVHFGPYAMAEYFPLIVAERR